MKLSVKILSLMMVLIVACTALVIPASAADGTVAVTYSVAKYDGVDTTGATADDIYAVTVYLNNTNPINSLLFPIYYRSDLFTPIDGADMSIMDWNYTIDFGAGLVRAAYAIPEGSDLADTNKYNKANVAAANRVVNARGAISGLGKGDVASAITNLDTRNPEESLAWWGELDSSKYGVITLQYSGQNNYCNLQAYGVETPLIQILFKRNAGVTDADVVGAQFGYVEGATVNNDNSVETDVTKFYYDKTSTAGIAAMTANYCTVEAAAEPSPVVAKTSQIRYNGPVDGDYAPFDVRTRAALSVDDFNALCTYDAATKATNIDKVGFVYADSSVGMTLENAAKVIGGTAVAGYVDVPVEHIQKTATEYVWTCLLEDAAYADAVDSVGYIVVDGETYYFDAVYATDFSTLYEAQKTHIPTA